MAMDSRKKTLGIILGTAASISVIVLCYLFLLPDTGARYAQSFVRKGDQTGALVPSDPFIDRMVRELKKCYAKTISQKSTQASLIGIRDFVLGTHPDNGRAVFYTILKQAFPDYADEIMETLAGIDEYTRWLEDNKKMLSRMTALERTTAMWEKRKELFGDDAEKIWSGDVLATEARKAKMQDIMAALNEESTTSIDEKLHVYQGALNETYKGTPEEYLLGQNAILSKVFFSIDSVQNELKNMSPEQRQMEINSIRRQMGFSEEQIEELAKRDAEKEQRWQVGYRYMQQREKVMQQYEGEEREERLKDLREQYFQDEAKTIELEEKDNFFRFERPRIYGRN